MKITIANNERISCTWIGLVEWMTEYEGWTLDEEEDKLYSKHSNVDIYNHELTKQRLTKWECILNPEPGGKIVTVNSIREIVRGETRPLRDQWIEPLNAPEDVKFWLGIDAELIQMKGDKPILGGKYPVTWDELLGNKDVTLKDTRMTFKADLSYKVRAIHLYAHIEGMDGDGPSEDMEYPVNHVNLWKAIHRVNEKATELWKEHNPEYEEES